MSKLDHLSKQLTSEVTFTILPLFWVIYSNNPKKMNRLCNKVVGYLSSKMAMASKLEEMGICRTMGVKKEKFNK